MRAFTSLAGHILGSHPLINGYFEMQICYEDASDLEKQATLFLENEDFKPGSRYLFDKLLHNEFVFKPGQLGLEDMKILVSLREPEQTIKSIVHLFAKKEIEDLYASPVEAAKYYIERVSALADFCEETNLSYYYFDAELLQGAPGKLLPVLSRWLELDTPLSERYGIFRQTGVSGRGDTSSVIRSGEISKSASDYSHIELPEEWLVKAREIYRECREQVIGRAGESVVC